MSEQNALSGEELDFIRQLYQTQLLGKSLHSPTFTIDGGPLANALLGRIGLHAQLSLDAQLGNYRMTFPLQLVEDEMHNLQLELGAPNIFEDGTVRRPWRLHLTQALYLLDEQGRATPLRVREISPGSLLISQENDGDLPQQFRLWLPLPGHEPIAVNGLHIRSAGPQLAAYRLRLNHQEHHERVRQYIFEQYRQRHPQLQNNG